MAQSERQKMAAGEWYCCLDPELDALRVAARNAVHQHNIMPPLQRGNFGPALSTLLPAPARVCSSRHHFTAPTASISGLVPRSI